ncbi:MAG: hypothetical protein ABL962_06475 [Fimbriimonadaceae bacterium]
MSKWREGQKVRIVTRPVTEEDKRQNRFFDHMSGLSGTIQNIFAEDQIAIKVDLESLSKISADVHVNATKRMREKFISGVGEEQRKLLTTEELNFVPNFDLLVRSEDLETV